MTQADSTKPSLLVVDDEPGISLAIDLLLKDRYQVTTAESAKRAMELLDRPYAAILLDLRLPDCVGYELLEHALRKAPATPIVILSASCDSRTSDEVTRRGAAGLIAKPFTRQELINVIQGILGK